MSVSTGHGLPFLPGNSFRDLTMSAYHRSQTLSFKNGYALPRRPAVGIGQCPLVATHMSQKEVKQLTNQTPLLTYGTCTRKPLLQFTPAHVAYDKKVLRFYGYFQQTVEYSPDEEFRVRPVVMFYYLEDDSMCVMEPPVENSGIPQGKLIKRQRLPRNERGETYHWKDLNLGMDVCVFGVLYRITHCDPFTQEFMESQGVVLNAPEPVPSDPYLSRRSQAQQSFTTPSDCDRLKQFLTMDRKVLRFFALWDYSDSLYGETRPVILQYYLADDTVEIREVHEPNSGRDPFPQLLRRQRLPKAIRASSESFPRCVLEVSPQEVQEYFSPKDFRVGDTLTLMGRRFLLHDCDEFTRKYYQQNHPEVELKPVTLEPCTQPDSKREVPPYNGFGSLEDSLQSCLSLVPEPPKKDLLKLLENDNKVLRYAAQMDSQNPQDKGRRFILYYFLSNDMISIFETPKRNSGIMAGKFLEKTRIPKPGTTVENPEFYSPADFAIGATVEVFRHRFVLTDADLYVLKYLESVSDQIPTSTLNSLRQRHGTYLPPDPEQNLEAVQTSDAADEPATMTSPPETSQT